MGALKCLTLANYLRRYCLVFQVKSKWFEGSWCDLLLVKFSSKVMHYSPSFKILKIGGASNLEKKLKCKGKVLRSSAFKLKWSERSTWMTVKLRAPGGISWAPGFQFLHGLVPGYTGSYFGKGTLSASGRGDEKRLEEVEIQIIGDYDGLLCVEIYGTWPVTVKVSKICESLAPCHVFKQLR